MYYLLQVLVKIIAIYFLWNWLMPEIFGLATITPGQAIGILVLSSALFWPDSDLGLGNESK